MMDTSLLQLAIALRDQELSYRRRMGAYTSNAPFQNISWEQRQHWLLRANELYYSHFDKQGRLRLAEPTRDRTREGQSE